MEKSATLHYISLAFIPRDCAIAPKSPLSLSKQKILEPPLLHLPFYMKPCYKKTRLCAPTSLQEKSFIQSGLSTRG